MAKYVNLANAYDDGTLTDWYIWSVFSGSPIWTEEHIEELLNDFYVIPKDTPVREFTEAQWVYRYTDASGDIKMYTCSECDWERPIDKHDDIAEYSFCPHCGAKINTDDKKENDDTHKNSESLTADLPVLAEKDAFILDENNHFHKVTIHGVSKDGQYLVFVHDKYLEDNEQCVASHPVKQRFYDWCSKIYTLDEAIAFKQKGVQNMTGHIHEQITDLESILTNHASEHSPEEIASIQEQLFRYQRIEDLWDEFGDIPLNPVLETIEQPWHGFPAGTHRETIWHWFEQEFNLTIAEDLLY